jgi:hypothetical protein
MLAAKAGLDPPIDFLLLASSHMGYIYRALQSPLSFLGIGDQFHVWGRFSSEWLALVFVGPNTASGQKRLTSVFPFAGTALIGGCLELLVDGKQA